MCLCTSIAAEPAQLSVPAATTQQKFATEHPSRLCAETLTASRAEISASRGEEGRLPSASGLGSCAFFSLMMVASSLRGGAGGPRAGNVNGGLWLWVWL